jgi:GDPmannose 4,6-dehydratase
LQGKSDKAQKKLNWKPKLSFEELVKIMVEVDLKRLKQQS